MTRPTARVLTLLEILQSGGVHTVARLAERLGVDERTVRRYAGHLLDLEIPIESVRGRYGGYRLAPGFRMPPLMLTGEEALAVVLGLMAGKRAGLASASESAAAKVRRVLPKTLGSRLEALVAAIDFTAPGSDGPTASVLLELAEAAGRRRPVRVDYVDRAGRSSERILHPYGMVAHSGRWYVTGLDAARGEMRTLRLDRIGAVRIVAGEFEVPADFQPADVVLNSLAGTPWRYEVVVAVRGEAEEVRTRLRLSLADVSPGDAGWSVVRFRAERLTWVPGVLAGLDLPFVIEQPAELREVVREWASRILTYADLRVT
ncbi:transcriptional regulator [Actinoplanes sp. OR16]|uniref:helix-turn-helix transcriptional regulator n=1 Tax=Actinoplanes sp. OR16 TaxID=946334 RepID=UPI000F7165C2|nr:YafY family protein [Actinoplanes sp. OR16]BBH71732.1 transcriptional regulator [Actinoplanes sp. OR16]